MKVFKKLATFIILVMVALTISVPVFAASQPYTDVEKRRLGVDAVKAITYLKKHHAFAGVVKGKKFYPNKPITRKEFLKILVNLFGKKKVPITATDRKKYNKRIRAKWVFSKLEAVAKRLGGSTRGGSPLNYVVPRYEAALYIYDFCKYDKKCRPRR